MYHYLTRHLGFTFTHEVDVQQCLFHSLLLSLFFFFYAVLMRWYRTQLCRSPDGREILARKCFLLRFQRDKASLLSEREETLFFQTSRAREARLWLRGPSWNRAIEQPDLRIYSICGVVKDWKINRFSWSLWNRGRCLQSDRIAFLSFHPPIYVTSEMYRVYLSFDKKTPNRN